MSNKTETRNDNENALDIKVLSYLSTQLAPVSALEIVKAVLGPHGTTKMINPTLYFLETKGKIKMERKGQKPFWSLVFLN